MAAYRGAVGIITFACDNGNECTPCVYAEGPALRSWRVSGSLHVQRLEDFDLRQCSPQPFPSSLQAVTGPAHRLNTVVGWPGRGCYILLLYAGSLGRANEIMRLEETYFIIYVKGLAIIPIAPGLWCKIQSKVTRSIRAKKVIFSMTHSFPFCLCPQTKALRFSVWKNSILGVSGHLKYLAVLKQGCCYTGDETMAVLPWTGHSRGRMEWEGVWRGWRRALARGGGVCCVKLQGSRLPSPKAQGCSCRPSSQWSRQARTAVGMTVLLRFGAWPGRARRGGGSAGWYLSIF